MVEFLEEVLQGNSYRVPILSKTLSKFFISIIFFLAERNLQLGNDVVFVFQSESYKSVAYVSPLSTALKNCSEFLALYRRWKVFLRL